MGNAQPIEIRTALDDSDAATEQLARIIINEQTYKFADEKMRRIRNFALGRGGNDGNGQTLDVCSAACRDERLAAIVDKIDVVLEYMCKKPYGEAVFECLQVMVMLFTIPEPDMSREEAAKRKQKLIQYGCIYKLIEAERAYRTHGTGITQTKNAKQVAQLFQTAMRNLDDRAQNEAVRETLIQGMYSRKSALRRAFYLNGTYDKQLLREIFLFLHPHDRVLH